MAKALDRYRPPAYDDFDAGVWEQIVEHFSTRLQTHRTLVRLLKAGDEDEYVQLALGLSDPSGNYSASEHPTHLGYRVLERTSSREIANFARRELMTRSARELPSLVAAADMPYLKTSIGSEMMCLLRPDSCWVTNRRTVYVYFLHQNGDDWERASEAIEVIAPSGDIGDTYDAWAAIHPEIVHPLLGLSESGRVEGSKQLRNAGLTREVASAPFLWADAIASWIYDWREWEEAE